MKGEKYGTSLTTRHNQREEKRNCRLIVEMEGPTTVVTNPADIHDRKVVPVIRKSARRVQGQLERIDSVGRCSSSTIVTGRSTASKSTARAAPWPIATIPTAASTATR